MQKNAGGLFSYLNIFSKIENILKKCYNINVYKLYSQVIKIMLTKKEIDELAHLSRLVLTDGESELMTDQINKLLNNFSSLQKLDTENVPPTSHAVPTYNIFREDTVKPSLKPEEVVANGSNVAENCFVVPKIVDTD